MGVINQLRTGIYPLVIALVGGDWNIWLSYCSVQTPNQCSWPSHIANSLGNPCQFMEVQMGKSHWKLVIDKAIVHSHVWFPAGIPVRLGKRNKWLQLCLMRKPMVSGIPILGNIHTCFESDIVDVTWRLCLLYTFYMVDSTSHIGDITIIESFGKGYF